MRYCNNCRRITPGDPLFCNFCGRSYNFKLCPRLHINPRSAEACSACGSQDLSTPQPLLPFVARVAASLLQFFPGVLLLLISVLFCIAFFQVIFSNPQLLGRFLALALLLGVLWYLYMQLPRFVRRGVWRVNKRKGNDGSS